MRPVIACVKFILFALLCIIVVPMQSLVLVFTKNEKAYILTRFWQRCTCLIFRIKIIQTGTQHTEHQTVYMSNHISYLDIPTLGSVISASFVAKKDVASWPLFGFLSKLQQTAFISRDRADARVEKNALDNMLNKGKSLIIFPEGTSTDGQTVIPFKSSLFSIAMKENLTEIRVQPITLSIKTANGHDIITQQDRDIYSWHINMDTPMHIHLWLFAKSKGAVVSVIFHPVLKAHDFSDRKTLAKACYNTVSNNLNS